MNVLILCWGSSCRSPMAKAFVDRELAERAEHVHVLARALHTPAESVASEAVEVMATYGLSIASHRPAQVSDAEIAAADVILVADGELLKDAAHRFPESRGSLFRLLDFATGEASDVRDPTGDVSEYLIAAHRLERAAGPLVARLLLDGRPETP